MLTTLVQRVSASDTQVGGGDAPFGPTSKGDTQGGETQAGAKAFH